MDLNNWEPSQTYHETSAHYNTILDSENIRLRLHSTQLLAKKRKRSTFSIKHLTVLFCFLPKNEYAGNFFQVESDKYNDGFCFWRNFINFDEEYSQHLMHRSATGSDIKHVEWQLFVWRHPKHYHTCPKPWANQQQRTGPLLGRLRAELFTVQRRSPWLAPAPRSVSASPQPTARSSSSSSSSSSLAGCEAETHTDGLTLRGLVPKNSLETVGVREELLERDHTDRHKRLLNIV